MTSGIAACNEEKKKEGVSLGLSDFFGSSSALYFYFFHALSHLNHSRFLLESGALFLRPGSRPTTYRVYSSPKDDGRDRANDLQESFLLLHGKFVFTGFTSR